MAFVFEIESCCFSEALYGGLALLMLVLIFWSIGFFARFLGSVVSRFLDYLSVSSLSDEWKFFTINAILQVFSFVMRAPYLDWFEGP